MTLARAYRELHHVRLVAVTFVHPFPRVPKKKKKKNSALKEVQQLFVRRALVGPSHHLMIKTITLSWQTEEKTQPNGINTAFGRAEGLCTVCASHCGMIRGTQVILYGDGDKWLWASIYPISFSLGLLSMDEGCE